MRSTSSAPARTAPAVLGALAAAVGLGLPAAAAAADGAAIYQQVCVACHQAGGAGAPGLAPALSGSLAGKAASPAVRSYLAQVVLHGLSGKIVVDGVPFTGAMPPQAQLADDQVAAVLTHVVADLAGQKGIKPFEPAEAAAARAAKPTAKDLRAQREAALAAK